MPSVTATQADNAGTERSTGTMRNPQRFTGEQALQAHEDGDPITVNYAMAVEIAEQHGATAEEMEEGIGQSKSYDAWDVLAWLGY